jgi:benzoate membrane transport protein
MRLREDFSTSALVAGFVAVLVGFTSSAAIVFQAARTLQATQAEIASWMCALGVGMGLTSIALSLRFRVPVLTAWSTPGAAMLITSAAGVSMPEAIGAFLVSAALITVSGFSGWFERVIDRIPISPLIGWSGAANLLLAPFGGFALNLAAITAAICMGREANENLDKRYVAAVAAGAFYLLIGLFGATVGALFLAFPRELVLAIAGFALLGTIGSALATSLGQEAEREPALLTFLVTASGITLAGVGSAFWGLLAGLAALLVLHVTPAQPRAMGHRDSRVPAKDGKQSDDSRPDRQQH